jgi:acetyl-CoA/propionyl-CoA carboxylase biotin carboxyl carrier protein
VTELVTGLDLVEQQIRVAAGQRLSLRQEDVELRGHAVEVRVYAEDPARGFLPSGGRVLALREPVEEVRVDSALLPGIVVGSDYDPMLAKYIAHGRDRDEALRRLGAALRRTTILGVTTNLGFLRNLLADADVRAGRLDTDLVGRRLPELVAGELPAELLLAAALERALELEPGPDADPWQVPGGWRIGEPAWTRWLVGVAGEPPVEVRLRGRAGAAEVVIGEGEPQTASARRDGTDLVLTHGGAVHRFACARDGAVLWLGREGRAWALTETERLAAARTEATAAGGPVTSPMPGTVLAVRVSRGEKVAAGQPLLIVEAMKMEHTVTAPVDGTVAELHVRAGQQVALGEALALVTSEEST